MHLDCELKVKVFCLKQKLILCLLFVILGLTVVSCGEGNSPTSGTTTAPTVASTAAATTAPPTTAVVFTTVAANTSGGLTLKKAYALVEPEVKSWQKDAAYTAVFNPERGSGLDNEGRAGQWFFETISPATLKRATWLVEVSADGKATATKSIEDTLDKERASLLESRKLPDITTLIDTDRLMEVARQNGGTSSDRPVGIRLAKPPKEGDPIAVDLLFSSGGKVTRLRIDMQSGKTVENIKG